MSSPWSRLALCVSRTNLLFLLRMPVREKVEPICSGKHQEILDISMMQEESKEFFLPSRAPTRKVWLELLCPRKS